MAYSALRLAANDRRSRALLHEALKSRDLLLVGEAIIGFANQRDESVLGDIERVLDESGEVPQWVIYGLVLYGTAAADRVAFKYLDETQREIYLGWRQEP